MRPVFALALSLVFGLLRAQDRHPIGFADTLIFNDSLHYSGFGYDGPAPLFVQAWFPLEDAPNAPRLTYAQFRERRLTGPLQRVWQELVSRMDSAFIEYDLRYAFNSDSLIDYAPFTVEQVKDSLMAMPTRAWRTSLRQHTARPVIVYHHGSGGFSDENAAMAENFASFGFIVLACNFHWPLENRPYGYPLTWEPDRHSVRIMLQYARRLGRGGKVFYIGHSWGAQEGWCTLHEARLADAFVSLETTLEWKTDTAEVRDKWPHVLEAITTYSYPMPILMVADTDGAPPYPMFKGVRADIRYLDPKRPFAHESFTSAYLLRQHGTGRFPVPDRDALLEQSRLYVYLFGEMLDFLSAIAGAQRPIHHYDDQEDPFHRYPVPAPSDPIER